MTYVGIAHNVELVARRAYEQSVILRRTSACACYRLSEDAYPISVLLVWKRGKDFLPGTMPDDAYALPKMFPRRKAYIVSKSFALTFAPPE